MSPTSSHCFAAQVGMERVELSCDQVTLSTPYQGEEIHSDWWTCILTKVMGTISKDPRILYK